MTASPLKSERGVALVLVMWALVFLSVLAANFASSMRVQATITRNGIDQTQAYYAARAGLEIGMARVLQRFDFVRRHGTRNADQIQGNIRQTPDEEKSEEELDEEKAAKIWRIDGSPNVAEMEGAALRVYITNEGGKIDLNHSGGAVIRNLLEQWGVDKGDIDIMVDSLTDWRDADNMHQLNGAEDDYYQKLDPPYTAKNADFSSVEELMRVRGFTRELLFSVRPESASSAVNTKKKKETDKKNQQKSDKGKNSDKNKTDRDQSEDKAVEEPELRLIDYFTVYNTSGKINLSYAPRAVIRSIPFVSDALTDRIMELREEVGGEKLTMALVRNELGDSVYNGIQNYVRVGQATNEDYFSVLSEAVMKNGFTAKIKTVAIINGSGSSPVQYVQWIDSVS